MLPYLEPVKTTLMEAEAAPQLSKTVAEFRQTWEVEKRLPRRRL